MSISKYKVSLFCREDASKIEGYDEAIKSKEKYDCHHRLELHTDGSLRFTYKSLKKLDLYYNRPACELIFLPRLEHMRLHTKARWESGLLKKKLGSPRKGMKWSHPMSEETKEKLSSAHKGRKLSEETKLKISESHKGMKAWNKGISLTNEHREHLSDSLKGRVRKQESIEKFRETMTGRKRKPFTEEWKHNLGNYSRGKTWRLVDGKRVWFEREVAK